jgi:predicted ribosome quality control (RQC) complex YloA/Tae2 family protein
LVPSEPRPAKDRFTSLDALALARELRALDHPRVDKAFDFGDGGWVLSFRTRPEGRRDLVLVPGRFGALAVEPVPHGDTPGPFARELRRLLSGAILVGVTDPAGERALDAEFARADGTPTLHLIVEFFGTGNILAVRGARLVAVAHPKTWAHRTLRVGADFLPPPAHADPWQATSAQLEVLLLGSTTDRASTLAARAGFGGPVAEELLIRAGLNAEAPAAENSGEVASAVRSAAEELLNEIGTTPAGYLYLLGDRALDVTPYPSRRRRNESGVVEERRGGFGPAVLEFFARTPVERKAPPAVPSPAAGLIRQRTQQAEAVDRLSAEAELRTAQANRIFERYEEAEAARSRGASDPDAPEKLEVPLGDLKVPLTRNATLESSARELYEEAKRAKTKLAGAREALAGTDARIAGAALAAAPVRVTERVAPPRREPHWFERFRWFHSSEGILVLAGRDAGSNDLVVRKYLRPGDRYIHAEIQGAASVVVKRSASNSSPEVGEPTLREAGQFAVAYSKGWRAGHASADAFWVQPDQVSKAGASGEFVARGAWVIHGTKNRMKDLPLELALGTVELEGATVWVAAPQAALRVRGTIRSLVTPGDERSRPEREAELVRDLGISRDRLQSLLPGGGFATRRT